MNSKALTPALIGAVVAAIIAAGIYEAIYKFSDSTHHWRGGLVTAAIVGVVTLIVAGAIGYFITQSASKKSA